MSTEPSPVQLLKLISDRQILARELQTVGLNVEEALAGLNDDHARKHIQTQETYWHGLGVSSVPTMVLNRTGALKGAQPVDIYKQVLAGLIDNKAKVFL